MHTRTASCRAGWPCLILLLSLSPRVLGAEEVQEAPVDFAAEQAAADAESKQIQAQGGAGGGGPGFKIIADLLLELPVRGETFSFSMNHAHVILQTALGDDLLFAIHISDRPLFYELTWSITPRLLLRAGKLFVPFGTNEFHHIIGGRVDERLSFLPETWTDYGVGLRHVFYDGDLVSAEYDLYAVNGFQGTERPVFTTGVLPQDNNLNKGLGARLRLDLFGHYALIGSLYYDVWDQADSRILLFTSVGIEAYKGFLDPPLLERIGLRAEWARGEIQLPQGNTQQGLLEYAFARSGLYGEITAQLAQALLFRFRLGLVNPDNTVTDESDMWVFEPALIIGKGKLTVRVAYQMAKVVGQAYPLAVSQDMLYLKFFLMY